MWVIWLIVLVVIISKYGFWTFLLTCLGAFALLCVFAFICESIIKANAKAKGISEHEARTKLIRILKWIAGITAILTLLVLLLVHC